MQADILKEDQGQNTCIFSTEFSLRMMADIQEWFIEHKVRNFYSVSISGYHIAEAGANPISQLAFTLSNGFTYVESYLARGMNIDDFAPNLSFFFSNGMDAEYTVIGRVARRIWAVAMRERYGANERSQKLKYHVQTSGRSLHAQEMDFNDIRTTLQALCALYDNANSLHTNAYDEAVTTPTEESVRRAMAIQLIINKEWGLAANENPLQGSFVVDELTDLVEEAVLAEFDRIAERGGVLGAMETGYQRGRIQDESMLYEHRKHDGTLPIVGVNTFVRPDERRRTPPTSSSPGPPKRRRRASSTGSPTSTPAIRPMPPTALRRLQEAATGGGNVFDELMHAARVCSLGQITEAFFEVGGSTGATCRRSPRGRPDVAKAALGALNVANAASLHAGRRAVPAGHPEDGAVDDHRAFDVVVYGATGFVGALPAAHLAEHAPPGTRIALAGRSREQAARGPRRAARGRPRRLAVAGGGRDRPGVARRAGRPRRGCWSTTVGPYARYGLPVVEACARAGTHYADLTGEVLFVRDAIDRVDDVARESGARIVHSCGYDSIPSDLGALLLHERAAADGAGGLRDVRLVATLRGGFSGGTIDSMRPQVDAMRRDPARRRVAADPTR